MSTVQFFTEIDEPKISELGGKGYSLAVLIKHNFDVPNGLVINSEEFFEFLLFNSLKEKIEKLSSEINETNFKEKSKEIRNLIINGKIQESRALEVEQNLNKLNVEYVSIRSSAVSEDSIKASFAGLYDTFLCVKSKPKLILKYVKKCWASLFTDRAVVYRIRKKMPHLAGMAVIVQGMVHADVSGTIFTVHPDTGDATSIVIESSWGLGESIVSGLVTPDRYIVRKKSLAVVRRILGRKKITLKADESGITQIDTPEDKMRMFCLDNALIESLTKISLNIENLYKYPQDIEWCISNNKIWILQSRPITNLEMIS